MYCVYLCLYMVAQHNYYYHSYESIFVLQQVITSYNMSIPISIQEKRMFQLALANASRLYFCFAQKVLECYRRGNYRIAGYFRGVYISRIVNSILVREK